MIKVNPFPAISVSWHQTLLKIDRYLYFNAQSTIRFDIFLVSMQCAGNSDAFTGGKRPAIVSRYPAPPLPPLPPVCSVLCRLQRPLHRLRDPFPVYMYMPTFCTQCFCFDPNEKRSNFPPRRAANLSAQPTCGPLELAACIVPPVKGPASAVFTRGTGSVLAGDGHMGRRL